MKHLDEGTLQAWLDMPRSGLDASEVAEIEGHLAVCEACAAELEALRESDGSVHSLLAGGVDRDIERPPFEEVVARAEGRVAETGGTRGGRGSGAARGLSRLNRMAWAASIAVALGVGWMTNEIYRAGPPDPSARVPVAPAAAPRAEVTAEAPSQAPEESRAEAPAESNRDRAAGGTDAAANEQARVNFGLTGPPAADEREAEPTARAERTDELERISPSAAAAPSVVADADDAAGAGGAAADASQDDLADAATDATRRAEEVDRRQVEEEARLTRFQDSVGTLRPVVRGVVRDAATGDPVSSAQVFVERLDIGALTGPDGSYTLFLPEADSLDVDVTVQRIGYGTETRELEVASGAPAVADFTLEEEALLLQEVVVTGTVGQAQRRALGNTADQAEESAFSWQSTTREAAEAVLGRSPLTVPDLPVSSVESADAPDAEGVQVVRIQQRLTDGGVLTLVEGVSDESRDGWSVPSVGALGSARMGRLLVTATAPITADALQELLRRIR